MTSEEPGSWLSFIGIAECMFAFDREATLKQNFESFVTASWMPFSSQYKEWILEYSDHQVMTIEAFILKYKERQGKKK